MDDGLPLLASSPKTHRLLTNPSTASFIPHLDDGLEGSSDTQPPNPPMPMPSRKEEEEEEE